jgi:tripartite-type tricarboxylate transporter receptor subunit TctC
MFPAGTAQAIVDKTHKALQQVLANEDVKSKLEGAGAIARLSAPAVLAKLIEDDIRSFQEVARKAGIEAK